MKRAYRNISATGVPPDMIERKEFHPLQAEEIARAFNEKGVDYLFIGKSGAILEYERLHARRARTSLGLGDCPRQKRRPGLAFSSPMAAPR